MLQSDIQQQQIPPKEGLQSKTEWQVVTNRIHAQGNEAAGGDRQEFCREENNIKLKESSATGTRIADSKKYNLPIKQLQR